MHYVAQNFKKIAEEAQSPPKTPPLTLPPFFVSNFWIRRW